jgi:hypothetical protein
MNADETDSAILQCVRQMRAEIGDMRAEIATKNDIADVRSEVHSLRADVASDIATLGNDIAKLDKKTGDQFASLRRAVMEYHSSVVRRVEQHLNLPARDPH